MKSLKRIYESKTLFGTIIVIFFWYLAHIALKAKIIPSPYETIIVFFKLMKGKLLIHVATSLLRILVSISISIIIAVPIGLWIGMNKKADGVISPIVYILYPIPKIAFLPVLMILFGLGDLSKVILIIIIIIFQILLATRDGVKEISKELFYSVKSLGLSQGEIYRNLVVPAVLPKIISALRISIGVSISVLFFAENFATTYGIGYFIMNCWTRIDYVEMFAGILALSILGIAIFKFIDLAEKELCPWIFIDK